ncbi:hypothetical protein [Paraburkholderia sp.]|jgi:hypothetical protein|uniref:hypothetical protein n=1 Tax=Paraburkholderia sp. TaxID=1926495 RepID=UPI002F3F24E7
MMSDSFISALKRLRSGRHQVRLVDMFIGTAFLSRNVGEEKYVSNRMDGMPDMSRALYPWRGGAAR